MSKKREKPWRRISRELDPELRVTCLKDRIEIHTMYNCRYRQGREDGWRSPERREQERGPTLSYILREMKMSDKEEHLLTMLEGTFQLIETLVKRYEGRIRWKEYQEKERRKKEWAAKKKVWDARKELSTRLQRVKDKKFGRMVEV
jgi:hypothetical protein